MKETNAIYRGLRYLKNNGVKATLHRMRSGPILEPQKIDVLGFYQFVMEDTPIPLDKEAYEKKKDADTKVLNWIIPEMSPGSGGHINIFRFISNLEEMGMHSRIYLYRATNFSDNQSLRAFLKQYFSILDQRVEVYCDVKYAEFAHATIATSWITAYFVKNFNNTISKFYFVQDYEPYFYALGSEYQMAEETYRLGFRGLTAGGWLEKKLADEFGMKTRGFGFSYDRELYKPGKKRDKRPRIFFYARPVTPRRDFEIGLLALNTVCQKRPEVEVVFAGWDVSNYQIPFQHKNLGVVALENLSDLYAQCDLCLVISNTNLSLLPLEIMASNSVAVCSKGENSTWLVNENNSILVDYEPISMAKTMLYYLDHPQELEVIRKNGLEYVSKTSWKQEAEIVYHAILEGIQEDEK